MPADTLAVSFAVGECFRSGARRVEAEKGSASQDPSVRGHMAGQMLGRIDDTLLVREAQRGNRAAFEELVRHYDGAVLRLAMHLTGSDHEAQDIYQEAFLKAYQSVGNLNAPSIPGSIASSPTFAWITCAKERYERKMPRSQ